ncbi:MAG: DUF1501 domain-containing protein [Bacteroidota bacterium]
MRRRQFIQSSSFLSLPIMVGGFKVSALAHNKLFSFMNGDSDRVLVLIQLNGGNDGLNSVIPLDQYDNLAQVRSNILVPESSVLSLTDTIGFHPNMGGLKTVFDEGKLNIIQGVAYPDQNRSHFRSTDIWTSGSAANEFLTTGWLGRYFDQSHPSYPEGYPNGECPDPFAITLGSTVSETCQGLSSNFSLALANTDNLSELASGGEGELPDGCYGDELAFVRESIKQTNAYSETILGALDQGNSLSTKYDDTNDLASRLQVVARMISGGLQTRVYVVSLGGFDTHANQVVDGEPTVGEHAVLLQSLSDAICAFQDDLQLLGLEERVIGMTFSEFGRRIRSNNSLGTDHGTAAPLMVFGSCVNPAILGDNPEISPDVGTQEGLPMQYDFRSVYGSILMDWFEVEENAVKTLLFDEFQYIPIIRDCTMTTSTEELESLGDLQFQVFPNPMRSYTTIEFESAGGWAKISLFDAIGNRLMVVSEQRFSVGTHRINMEGHNLPAGSYYLRIQTDHQQKTKRLVKL